MRRSLRALAWLFPLVVPLACKSAAEKTPSTTGTGASASSSGSGGGGGTATTSSTGSGAGGSSSSGLDPSFGTNGVAANVVGTGETIPLYLAAGSSGTLLAAGIDLADEATFVTRLTSAGAVDTSFGQGGSVLVTGRYPGAPYLPAGGFTVQADGKILIVIDDVTGEPGFSGGSVVRLDASGALDASFGAGGRAELANMAPAAAVVASDGSLFVVGGADPLALEPLVVARLTAAGALDPSFGQGGTVQIANAPIGAVAQLDAQGRIVVASSVQGQVVQLARVLPSGALDASFGTGGVVSTTLQAPSSGGGSGLYGHVTLAFQADGSILVGSGAIQRYGASGARDTSFGSAGTASVDLGGFALAPDGSLFAVQATTSAALVHLTADGQLDTSFGQGGKATLANSGFSVLVLADGEVATCGYGLTSQTGQVERTTAAGSADAAFGQSGLASVDTGATGDLVLALAQQADGSLVAVGGATASTHDAPAWTIARYGSDGALDGAFTSGNAILKNEYYGAAIGVAVDASGNLVVAGSGLGCGVARITSSGAADPTFGAQGYAAINPSSASTSCSAMALDASGRVLVAGQDLSTNPPPLLVARFTTQGALDTSFGTQGLATAPLSAAKVSGALASALQPDGSIVAAGYVGTNTAAAVAVARFTSAGALDTSFNGQGWATFTTPSGSSTAPVQAARAAAIQGDGKIVVVGSTGAPVQLPGSTFPASSDFWGYVAGGSGSLVVARLLADGTLDTSFGQGGLLETNLGLPVALGEALLVDADGSLTVGGVAWDGQAKRGFVAKVSSSGALDSASVTLLHEGLASAIHALLVQPSGKLVAGGSVFQSPTGSDLALFRLP